MPSQDEIFEKVRGVLVDALGVDDDEVTREATLIGDLGAESIDFLDISFQLDKAFGVQFPRGELFPEDLVAQAGLAENGVVTASGLEVMRQRMPFADIDGFSKNPKVANIRDLFTVDMVCKFIGSKVS